MILGYSLRPSVKQPDVDLPDDFIFQVKHEDITGNVIADWYETSPPWDKNRVIRLVVASPWLVTDLARVDSFRLLDTSGRVLLRPCVQ